MTPILSDLESLGYIHFEYAGDHAEMLQVLRRLRFKPSTGSNNFQSNAIQVSVDPFRFFRHPVTLAKPLRDLYFQIIESVTPISKMLKFSTKWNGIDLRINRCEKGYFRDWYQDNDGKTALVVIVFFTDGGLPGKDDGGQFQIRKSRFLPPYRNDLLTGYLHPVNGTCIALNTSTSMFEYRGEPWCSETKTRYFIRIAFKKWPTI